MLGALQVLHTQNSAWEDHTVFEKVAAALNGIPVSFDHVQKLAPSLLGFAVACMKAIKRDRMFHEDIQRYIAATCASKPNYLFFLPPPMGFAQAELLTLAPEGFESLLPELENALVKGWAGIKDEVADVQLDKARTVMNYVRVRMGHLMPVPVEREA
jgi:hypothetical protein